jgi:drug/metabolite transporter (DMT)-like permease
MMDLLEPYLWVFVTVLAVIGQSLRSAIQKRGRDQLGVFGSAFVRFLYGVPLSFLLLFYIVGWSNIVAVRVDAEFVFWVSLASLLQILFTVLLGLAFESRNFMTSIALSKTDAVQAAFFEFLLLSFAPDIDLVIAIIIGFFAIFFIGYAGSSGSRKRGSFSGPSVSIGLLAGLCLGSCSVFYRIAMEALPELTIIEKATFTATIAVLIQTLTMGVALMLWRRTELLACLSSWRSSSVAGSIASITTVLWFIAFSMMGVAHVRMVGQIEIIFSLLFSLFFFKEKVNQMELLGACLITLSLAVLIL